MKTEHAKRIYFEQVRRLVPITAVLLQRYGIELKRRGSILTGCCPIHNGSNPRQFSVDENKGLWHCFGDCKRGGDVLTLVAELEKVDIAEAALLIARWFAISSGSTSNQLHGRRTGMSGQPTMKAFVVEDRPEGDERDAFWTRVGSAWPHGDGKGLNVVLASGVSVSGRLVLREYSEPDDAADKKKVVRKK